MADFFILIQLHVLFSRSLARHSTKVDGGYTDYAADQDTPSNLSCIRRQAGYPQDGPACRAKQEEQGRGWCQPE
jgi:hypothetical protein